MILTASKDSSMKVSFISKSISSSEQLTKFDRSNNEIYSIFEVDTYNVGTFSKENE